MHKKYYKIFYIIQIYLCITVLLYFFGPIKYTKINLVKTISLIFIYNISFFIGCILAYKYIEVKKNIKQQNKKKWTLFFYFGCTLSIILNYLYLIQYSNNNLFNNIIENILNGIKNPDEAYFYNLNIEKDSNILTQLMTSFSPITYGVIPLGLMNFDKLKLKSKILIIIVIFLEMSIYLIKGTNFGLFKVIFIFMAIYIIKDKKAKNYFFQKVIILLVLFYFLYNINSRMSLMFIPDTINGIEIDKNHILFKLMPEFLSITLMLAISYISQGYYALALATKYEFLSTYGLGGGIVILNYAEKVFNLNLFERTYQYRMNEIWNSRVNWHTIYVWLANDISLYGVPIIMFLIGFIFSLIYKDSTKNKNLIAIILFPLYLTLIIFIPCNNIIFNNPLMLVPFIFYNVMWLLTCRLERSK